MTNKYGFTTKTRDSTIAKKLREAGKSEDYIKGYLKGWNAVKGRTNEY